MYMYMFVNTIPTIIHISMCTYHANAYSTTNKEVVNSET